MSDEVLDKFLLMEQKIIFLALKYKTIVKDLLDNKITSDLFSERHRFLIGCIFKEYLDNETSFPRLLTRDSYEHYLVVKYGNSPEILVRLKDYDACVYKVSASVNDTGTLISELVNAYAARHTQGALVKYEKNLSSKGAFLSAQELSSELDRINIISSRKQASFTTAKDMRHDYLLEKKKQRENPAERITSGIMEIDNAMVVGFAPQTLTVFVADVGKGKTTMMINIGLSIVEKGYNVLFVSLEMPRILLMDKIMSNFSGIDFKLIAQPDNMTEEQYIEFEKAYDKWDKTKGNFAILDAEERITMSRLRREIDIRAMVFKPHVVIVDYIGIVKPEVRYQGRNDLEIGEITKELRFLGKKYGFGTISGAQLNREAIRRMRKDKDQTAGGEDVKGSGEISADADFIFALFPSEGDDNKIKCQNIKTRYTGSTNKTFSLFFDGSRCKIGNYDLPNMMPNELDLDFSPILSPSNNDENDDENESDTKKINNLDDLEDIG
jgi:replicative DNA helicase